MNNILLHGYTIISFKYLGFFPFFTIPNSSAVNVLVNTTVCTDIFLQDQFLEVKLFGSEGMYILINTTKFSPQRLC